VAPEARVTVRTSANGQKRTSWFPNELPSYQDNATYKQRYANETRQINMSLSDSKPSKMIDG